MVASARNIFAFGKLVGGPEMCAIELNPAEHLDLQNLAGSAGTKEVVNALSVDVEDYFQVSAFEKVVPRDSWDSLDHRVERNTDRVLQLFADFQVRSTFFLLGWVVERYPDLARRIEGSGHELAIHGYDHRRIHDLEPEEFRRDIRKAKRIVEDSSGARVVGYRAPSYSVVAETIWALEILAEEGFLYDSSIFPIRHDRYGIPNAPRHPWVAVPNNSPSQPSLVEFPISTVRVLGVNLPFVGGGYLRQFPMPYIRWGMRHLNRRERMPAIVYIHPWEVDPEQPRQAAPLGTRIRHYRNIAKTEGRLSSLLGEFKFDTVRRVLDL